MGGLNIRANSYWMAGMAVYQGSLPVDGCIVQSQQFLAFADFEPFLWAVLASISASARVWLTLVLC